jgi:hypothetical protein
MKMKLKRSLIVVTMLTALALVGLSNPKKAQADDRYSQCMNYSIQMMEFCWANSGQTEADIAGCTQFAGEIFSNCMALPD